MAKVFNEEKSKWKLLKFVLEDETSFEIELEEGQEQQPILTVSKKLSDNLNGIHILIAEDNDYNRMVVNDYLELRIPEVKLTNVVNGQECINIMLERGNDFDLILMDVQMPVKSGLIATREIRKMTGKASQIPILGMTASVVNSNLEECFAVGMNGYVPKPFKIEELLEELGNNFSSK